jgi:rRNA maturation endonuclease Nob1
MDRIDISGGNHRPMKKCVVCIQNKTEQMGEVLDLALTLIDSSIIVMCICEGCYEVFEIDVEEVVMAVVQ